MTRRFALLLSPALLMLALLPVLVSAPSQAASPTLYEGIDYQVLEKPGTFDKVGKGEVEIVEVFAYTCPHCAHFAPQLDAWKATLPKNVRVRYVPAGYDTTDTLSRGFFASQSLGALPRTHNATFRALHDERTLPMNPTDAELAAYYGTLGVDAQRFAAAMASPKVAAEMQRAHDFAVRIALSGTPELIVAGRWRVLGGSTEEVLRNAAALAANPPK
jgi:thiol:disulfide interchange protein DsbA